MSDYVSEKPKVDGGSDEPKVAKIVGEKPREKMVPLEWGPIEFDGKKWTEIPIHRVSGAEVDAYLDDIKEGRKTMPPMVACPREVWDAMDDDDRYTIDQEIQNGFFPQRLRAALSSGPGILESTQD